MGQREAIRQWGPGPFGLREEERGSEMTRGGFV